MLGSLRPLLSLKARLGLFEQRGIMAWHGRAWVREEESVMREMTTGRLRRRRVP